ECVYTATLWAHCLDAFEEPAAWIGHSFGGRLTMEVAAVRPELVRRAVLLDPAIFIPPFWADDLATDARKKESYSSVDEAIQTRIVRSGLAHTPREILEEEVAVHGVEQPDGCIGYRYSENCVGDAYMELAKPAPPVDALRIPTLVVVASLSKIVGAGEVELYKQALGDLFTLEVVPGGHSVLWDASDETAAALEPFLEGWRTLSPRELCHASPRE